jgi:hypothetical protein
LTRTAFERSCRMQTKFHRSREGNGDRCCSPRLWTCQWRQTARARRRAAAGAIQVPSDRDSGRGPGPGSRRVGCLLVTTSSGRCRCDWHRGGAAPPPHPPRPSDAGPPRRPIRPRGEWPGPLQVETEYRRHRQLELELADPSQPDSEPRSPSERGACHGISNLSLAGWQAGLFQPRLA